MSSLENRENDKAVASVSSNNTSSAFGDEDGKKLTAAMEQAGTELNSLTENLERQFNDETNENGEAPTSLGKIDVKEIISTTMDDGATPAGKGAASERDENRNGKQSERDDGDIFACEEDRNAVDDIIGILNSSKSAADASPEVEPVKSGGVSSSSSSSSTTGESSSSSSTTGAAVSTPLPSSSEKEAAPDSSDLPPEHHHYHHDGSASSGDILGSRRESLGASSMDADSIQRTPGSAAEENMDADESTPAAAASALADGGLYPYGGASASASTSSSTPTKKISELIYSLRQRAEDPSVQPDEWVNDDDTGYIVITLSEEEFYDFEEETSARILSERRQQKQQQKKKEEEEEETDAQTATAAAATPPTSTPGKVDSRQQNDREEEIEGDPSEAESGKPDAAESIFHEVKSMKLATGGDSADIGEEDDGECNDGKGGAKEEEGEEDESTPSVWKAIAGSITSVFSNNNNNTATTTATAAAAATTTTTCSNTATTTAAVADDSSASLSSSSSSAAAAADTTTTTVVAATAITAAGSDGGGTAAAIPPTSAAVPPAAAAAAAAAASSSSSGNNNSSNSSSGANRDECSNSSESSSYSPSNIVDTVESSNKEDAQAEQLASVLAAGGFASPPPPPILPASSSSTAAAAIGAAAAEEATLPEPAPSLLPQTQQQQQQQPTARRQSVAERRRSEIMGQKKFMGVDGIHCYFNLKVIFEPYKTGFEENKDLQHPRGTILAGRYEVQDMLGQAAFSTALQCVDLAAEEHEEQWVCLKVIKNNKDFFDQSLDEIKLLQYINSCGDADEHHVLRLIDFFYCKEHLFIVSELLKENLYEFGRFIRESDNEPYYTMPRLKRIMKQVLEALVFIHSLNLIHCDIKPENIVIKSFSRCEVKLIDFGSSCFTSDHLTTYIQSRSYRAPEVIIGHKYDTCIDIWSVGAVLAELHTGYVLFQNDSVPTMLSRITGVLGAFPQHVLSRGKDTGKYFSLSNIVYERDDDGSFQLIFPKKTDLASRLHLPEDPRRDTLSEEEELFLDFVRQMLHLDPARRLTADQALRHPWLADADTVHVSEYIIGGGGPPPPEEDEEESDSEEEGEESADEYEDEDDSQVDAAEAAALEYLLYASGTGRANLSSEDASPEAEAMEAYVLQQLQLQKQNTNAAVEGEEEGEEHDGAGGNAEESN